MASSTPPAVPIVPGRSLGFMLLGASIHDILTRVKAQPSVYPKIELIYDLRYPIAAPIFVALPHNGLRLRFDGPDQRLRLIEVLDFSKTRLSYKNVEVVKAAEAGMGGLGNPTGPTGPRFRHVYDKLLGPTYAGEFLAPKDGDTSGKGIYVLSYPGIAFNFLLDVSAWSADKDFVSLLSSSATSAAKSMAIFDGESWPKARGTLFTNAPLNPRSLELAAKANVADEIEVARMYGEGRVELVRRSSPSFWLQLSVTSPQQLVEELGPPDAIYHKSDRRLSIHGHAPGSSRSRRFSNASSDSYGESSSEADETLSVDAEGSDSDSGSGSPIESSSVMDTDDTSTVEHFYNYFHHGFDILISTPVALSVPSPTSPHPPLKITPGFPSSSQRLVATKIIFHGNIPGSYPFNRHRRSRWTLEHVPTEQYKDALTSEMPFADIQGRLKEAFKSTYANEDEERSLQRSMVLNRGWGDSPGSSCELLGGFEEGSRPGTAVGVGVGAGADAATAKHSAGASASVIGAGGQKQLVDHNFGISELYGFPGLIFEVLKNGTVSALTVY
ncbi:uncharacterized protein K452DRAFT_359438 [Aplosporella prunicola CBS 121167]|uniref:Uncharacterized protein n=1 Tax=Aplosporella prunicola CBS 121167 TaxID=1176127 RepID=A0A6A6BDP5_9PEZI|nr:uncharacterized protein K452DRAFT_359438 [Aplosporella prunicola CBS 121167]KAF2141037.1 hypothetical protein K452DRAFT_359438 [Aplosporella prunicola CBS 121167]